MFLIPTEGNWVRAQESTTAQVMAALCFGEEYVSSYKILWRCSCHQSANFSQDYCEGNRMQFPVLEGAARQLCSLLVSEHLLSNSTEAQKVLIYS